jgi:DNA-binding beta-propeller fold protein YncE
MFCRVLLLFLVSLPPIAFFPFPAQADGGAPNLAYVAGTPRGISIIDIAQEKVTGTIAADGNPYTILLSLDGRFLYVTQPALGRISIIAARTGQTVCSADLPGHPTLLALSSDGTVLYAAGNEGNISAIDATTCAVRQTFETNDRVYGLAIVGVTSGNSWSDQLLVAGTTSLTIFNEKGQQLDSIPLAGGPQYLCLPGALTVYVTTRQGNVVAVDLGTRQVSPPLLTGGKFGLMDYNAITGEVYVPDQQANQLDVLTPFDVGAVLPSNKPNRVIRLNGSPQSVAITSDGQLGFVALRGGNVAMLDIPGRHTVKTIFVGGNPHFIITGLYPPVGYATPQQAAALPLNTIIALLISVLLSAVLLSVLWLMWRQHRR